jgi:formate hydrogenlyase subunit 4
MDDKHENSNSTDVPKILRAVKSPLSFLTFSAIICETVFGIVGAFTDNPEIIIFSMHMFLAIVGALILIAVWCPKSLYHPNDIKDIDIDHEDDNTGKWVVTISLAFALIAYMIYMAIMSDKMPITEVNVNGTAIITNAQLCTINVNGTAVITNSKITRSDSTSKCT